MRIDRNLCLVVPVEREDGSRIHVHATPISDAVFDNHYLLLAQTFTAIHKQGLGIMSGPSVAARVLNDLARQQGEDGIRQASTLFAEMHRLMLALVPTDRGWEPVPFDEAVRKELMDTKDVAEVDNAVVFFTCAWHIHRKSERRAVIQGAAQLWGASTTSLNSTEYATSLPTSTETASSGASPAPGSSVPS
jgi:hypothetical protein